MGKEDEEKIDQKCREHRDANFAAEVKPERENMRLYPDEAILRVTYNGHQYYNMSLNKREAEKAVMALVEYFHLHSMFMPVG